MPWGVQSSAGPGRPTSFMTGHGYCQAKLGYASDLRYAMGELKRPSRFVLRQRYCRNCARVQVGRKWYCRRHAKMLQRRKKA